MGLHKRQTRRESGRVMLRINELSLPLGSGKADIQRAAGKALGIPVNDFRSFTILRESIDSRKKNDIKMIYAVGVELDGDEASIAARFPSNKVLFTQRYEYTFPTLRRQSRFRPVVVGFGPAGMFAGLMLAKAGLNPIILERGEPVEQREESVRRFWTTRELNTESNVQFGEGGAGTFSDGKLTTGIKDGRCREVLRQLVKHGAPDDILYSAKPHIGTDLLPNVVRAFREEILSLGGEVRFGCRMTDVINANGAVYGLRYVKNGVEADVETDAVILCVGHSARDTVTTLYHSGIRMEQKAFSVGTRIEHPQDLINRAQYGALWNDPRLGAADYKLSNHPPHGRGAYTFCMCPGGTVVTASSENEMVVTNGMSRRARDGENANSAILVGIEPGQFESDHPLAGFDFQRMLERKAYAFGGSDYTAPAQLLGDFLRGKRSTACGTVRPSCPTGVSFGAMTDVLPPFVTQEIEQAIRVWDRRLRGFALNDAVLTYPESRSSSPVRILRDHSYQANIRGLYPCGEGAGYAGGIVSAAADGIRCAEAVISEKEVTK